MMMMLKAHNSEYPIITVVAAGGTVTTAETATVLEICHKSRYTIWSTEDLQ
jgi:hypothetical protein